MADKAVVPSGVRLDTALAYECEVRDGETWVVVQAPDTRSRHSVRATVWEGGWCNVKVEGEGNADLRVDGAGEAHAVLAVRGNGMVTRTGPGKGNAYRYGPGAGDAVRDGDGCGEAIRRGTGKGNAVRKGAGEGHALRSGHGDGWAHRGGQGNGNAERSGTGAGNARRTDSGNGNAVRADAGGGNAVRSGKGDGDAFREGDGKGDAMRYTSGYGAAVRSGSGAGAAFTAPEMTVAGWLGFIADYVRERHREALLGCAPAQVHAQADKSAQDALIWLQCGDADYRAALLASSPELARTRPARKGGKPLSVAKSVDGALHALAVERVLAEIRSMREEAKGENANSALGACFDEVITVVEDNRDSIAAEEDAGERRELACAYASEALENLGLDLDALIAVFDENRDLWEEEGRGETPEEQMRKALLGRMERYAIDEIEIMDNDLHAGAAPAA